MALPTVGNLIAKGGTSGVGTTLVLTLTAAANKNDIVFVAICQTVTSSPSAVDSQGNVYADLNGGASIVSGAAITYILGTVLLKALGIGDTITITTASGQGHAAVALQLTGVSVSQICAQGYAARSNSGSSSGVSVSATNPVTPITVDDVVALFLVGTNNAGALAATDFTSGSVDQSYVNAGSAISTGGTSNAGICLCYKTVVAPVSTQGPTFTLNTSRTWGACVVMLSGLMAFGAIGVEMRDFKAGSFTKTGQGALGAVNIPLNVASGRSAFDVFPNTPGQPQPRRGGDVMSDPLFSSEA